jgi:hypothetical protein
MNSQILLEELTFPEKIGLMEDLWNHLSRENAGFTPPEWHGEVLQIRKKRIESGDIGFTDWEVAKKCLRGQELILDMGGCCVVVAAFYDCRGLIADSGG